ncbi:MAG: putative toxin-antitoxin system toxin component, PIN family [Acidimicrobiales bacterium]
MLRVVIDPNVVVSAAISPDGVTGRLVSLGLAGHFRMIVCPMLLDEARIALSRPRLRRFVALDAALELLGDIEGAAESHADPAVIQGVTRDRGDDYLVALAGESAADRLVSGDGDLLALAATDPRVLPPRVLLDELTRDD